MFFSTDTVDVHMNSDIVDSNECEEIAGICANGDCINLDGGFSCRCKSGFRLSSTRDSCLGKTFQNVGITVKQSRNALYA